jgi:hypothetical protein
MTAPFKDSARGDSSEYGETLAVASILVIDDEPGMRNFLTKVLEPHWPFRGCYFDYGLCRS